MAQLTYKEKRDLVLGKLVYKTVDADYEELSEKLFGEGNCYNSSEVRKRMYGMKTLIDDIDREREEYISGDAISDLEEKKIELQKERQRFFDQRSAYNKMIRDESRDDEIKDIIRSSIEHGDLPSLSYGLYERKIDSDGSNDLIVSLNDIHYGACVDNYWRKYDTDICEHMMIEYADRIIEIGKRNNSSCCYVLCNGDMISGNIHYSISVTNKEDVISQTMGVSEVIAGFLAYLSMHFERVSFMSIAGNHSRISPDKEKSVISERLDNIVAWYLEARLSSFDNISFKDGARIDNTMYLIDIRGKTYCGIHGDFDNSPSSVQSLQTMAEKPLYAVLSGHMHHNKTDSVQGIKTLMAGSFLGLDDFCVQKRIYGKPEQMVCVCDKNGIRCHYDIEL